MRIALLTLTRGNVSGGVREYLDYLVPLLRSEPDVESIEVFGGLEDVIDAMVELPEDLHLRNASHLAV